MRRAAVLMVLVAACAGDAGMTVTSTMAPEGSTVSAAPSTTTIAPTEGTTIPVEAPWDERELAPDFALSLADGGTYTLSAGNKPVYLVFWAEWCPVCRRELPVVDRIAAEYGDRIDFVAPVWKSGEEAAAEAAATLFQSGRIMWGMDSEEVVFGLYGVPYQPVTVLIAGDKTVVDAWAGVRSEEAIRQALDELLEL